MHASSGLMVLLKVGINDFRLHGDGSETFGNRLGKKEGFRGSDAPVRSNPLRGETLQPPAVDVVPTVPHCPPPVALTPLPAPHLETLINHWAAHPPRTSLGL